MFPQIRHKFGCKEEVREVEGRKVRQCNWVRFLRSSNDVCEVNVIAQIVDSVPMFQVVRPIKVSEELVAFFDEESLPKLKISQPKMSLVSDTGLKEFSVRELTQRLKKLVKSESNYDREISLEESCKKNYRHDENELYPSNQENLKKLIDRSIISRHSFRSFSSSGYSSLYDHSNHQFFFQVYPLLIFL